MIDVTLEKIRNLAKSDAPFKDAIIKTAKEKPSIVDFCKVCREAGIEICPDIFVVAVFIGHHFILLDHDPLVEPCNLSLHQNTPSRTEDSRFRSVITRS